MTMQFSNALFISDLHLMEDRPECIRAFFQFLTWIPERTDALFILGDFFEYWVGDDVELPYSGAIAAALADAATNKNIQIFFMPGNRDFALGQDYCRRSQMRLITDDELQIQIGKQRVLLSHGDLYCTNDIKYLRYRKIIRHPRVLKILLSLSKKRRIKIAQSIRESSRRNYQKNPVPIDVTPSAIEQTLAVHQSDILVHGHTHLADIHLHGETSVQTGQKRMVLGDWHEYGWYGRIDNNGPTLHRFAVTEPVF